MSSIDQQLLEGRYRLLTPIGSGGMGTVWHARDERLDRDVAVKEIRLPPELGEAERAELCARTVREAQAAGRLRHPAIVTVHDVVTSGGHPWIVMRLLRGRPLDRVGPLDPPRAARLGLAVLDALTLAHAAGILHRDIKPANVFVSDDGSPVLTDFGIATVEGQATLTQSGMLLGSPGYIAPERLRGERPGPQSDLWSLAATLYASLEGEPAHPGEDGMAVLARVLTEDPRPPQRSGPLGPLLTRMLARDPAARPPSSAVRDTLAAVAGGVTPPPLPPPPAPPPHTTPSGDSPGGLRGGHAGGVAGGPWRRRWLLVAASAGVAALVAAAAVVVVNARAPVTVIAGPSTAARSVPVTPGGTGAATGAAAPVEEQEPRFTVPIDLCTLVTGAQAAELVPGSPKGEPTKQGEQAGCAWASKGVGLFVNDRPFGTTYEDMWDSEPVDAHDAFVNLRNARQDTGGPVVWNQPAIGLTEPVSSDRSAARDVPGLGSEALTYDALIRHEEDVIRTVVVYRTSNVLLEVTYIDLTGSPSGQIRERAVRAARWSAAALEEKAP